MTAAFAAPAATQTARNRSRKATCRQRVTAQTHAKFVMRPHARSVMCPCQIREVLVCNIHEVGGKIREVPCNVVMWSRQSRVVCR